MNVQFPKRHEFDGELCQADARLTDGHTLREFVLQFEQAAHAHWLGVEEAAP